MRIFKEVFIANVKEMIRDKDGLFWTLAFPVIFIFIFGIVFSGNGEYNFDIGVVIESENPLATQLLNGFKEIETFTLTQGTKEEELSALEKGNRNLVLILPDIDYNQLFQGKTYQIPVFYNATQTSTNQVLLPIIQQIFTKIEDMVTGKSELFEIVQEPVQSRQLTNFDYILPGILAMSLMQLGLFGSFRFLSLREQKVIRGLGVTPLPRSIILGSEILLRVLVAFVQTFLIVFIGTTVFKVTIVGNIVVLIGTVLVGSLTFTSLGYMLIAFSKTMEAGQGLIQVVQFPMMFLSGIFFPVAFMPSYIQPVVKALPLTYLGNALREVMVGATSNHSLIFNLGVLVAFLIVTLVIAVRFWKWE